MDSFASALSSRLKQHPEFWYDLAQLQSAGIAGSMPYKLEDDSGRKTVTENLGRLLYSASVFAQTPDEANKGLAQTIALSAILTTEDAATRELSARILANIGNFPGVQFLREKYEFQPTEFLAELHIRLLRSLNSVKIGSDFKALTDFQVGLWRDLPELQTAAISAPTSAGKSFLIIEYLCQRALSSSSFTAVYIAPTRALLAEVHRRLSERLAGHPEIRVCTVPSLDSDRRPKQIYVLTQERLYVLLSVAALSVDLVVVDEVQNLGDSARGMILQDCLERLRNSNAAAQILMLAPGADGFPEVGRLLGLGGIDVHETALSPVLQNRVLVKVERGNAHRLSLSLLNENGTTAIGDLVTKLGLADPATRLAATALELGRDGAALVYATGPADAEKTAAQLTAGSPTHDSERLAELSKFIKSHIHPSYSLGNMVRHGVGFHFGKMPTLLREAIEDAFRTGDIRFLVCTTTLFQGVNLPARNVFINTPTRGKGKPLDAAALWNFAGRAGRLGKDIVGNVFLVDYHQWQERPLDERVKFRVVSALATTVKDHYKEVLLAVGGQMPVSSRADETPGSVRAAAGLLLANAARSSAREVLERIPGLEPGERHELSNAADAAITTLALPAGVLENNWTVNPYGLARLQGRMRAKIAKGEIDDLIPVHPREPSAFERYTKIFNRIGREVLEMKVGRYGAFVATYAVPWMKGEPYPVLLGRWITYHRRNTPSSSLSTQIRNAFNFVEDVLRFQSVQLAKAYLDVLDSVLTETNQSDRRIEVFDYALALELGVSSNSGRAFVELGLSRIAATALEVLIPDSELTATAARTRLQELDTVAAGLSRVIIDELEKLNLIKRPETSQTI